MFIDLYQCKIRLVLSLRSIVLVLFTPVPENIERTLELTTENNSSKIFARAEYYRPCA